MIYLAALHTRYGKNGSAPPTSRRPPNLTNGVETLHATRQQQSSCSQTFPKHLKSIYIQSAHPFPQVESFVQSSSSYYHLNLYTSSLPMKAAFTEYLRRDPQVRAIFVGTRRTDPHGGALTHFDETDRGWPKFMRVHPVIDWHYQEIWAVRLFRPHTTKQPARWRKSRFYNTRD